MIAGSASNGGAAVLRAAEQDTAGLIDGVVASEPVTEMPTAAGYGILFGGVAVTGYGKTLAEYVTYAQPLPAVRCAGGAGGDGRDLGLQLPRAHGGMTAARRHAATASPPRAW